MFFLCSFICSTHLNSEIIILGTSHKHKNISLADTYSPAALCRRGGHPNTTLKHPGGTVKGSQVATHTLSPPGPGLPPLLSEPRLSGDPLKHTKPGGALSWGKSLQKGWGAKHEPLFAVSKQTWCLSPQSDAKMHPFKMYAVDE